MTNREKETKLMMEKYNKLKESYNTNNFLDVPFVGKLEKPNFDVLDLQDEDIMSIIEKAKNEMKACRVNIHNINLAIKKHEKILEDIIHFKQTSIELSKIYDNLSIMSGRLDMESKLPTIKHFGLDYTNEAFMDAYKKEIDIKIDSLKKQFTEHAEKISRFKKLILKATPKESVKNTCSICATHKIDICINPCGHVYCQSCSDKMRNCGVCRGSIDSKIKLFLDNDDDDDDDTNNVCTISTIVEPPSGYTSSINDVTAFTPETDNYYIL